MSTMTMRRATTRPVRTTGTTRSAGRTRGPVTRPSAMSRPAGRPVNPSRPVIVNSRPVVVESMPATTWHLTDRGIAVIMGLGAAQFAAAAVVIVLQFIALGAPIA